MTEKTHKVTIQNIFEGPMDLLIYLIKKNEVDIHDIPISLITRQYLEYVEWIRLVDVDNAGDFLLMTSTLLQIKSKMLLPVHEGEEEEEDPRMAIARPLIDYLKIKSVAEALKKRPILGDDTFKRQTIPIVFKDESPSDEIVNVGLFELIDAFQKIMDDVQLSHDVDFSTDTISIQDKITELNDILEIKGSLTFDALFSKEPTKTEIIVTFLAILEMVKLSLVRVVQHVETNIFRIIYQ